MNVNRSANAGHLCLENKEPCVRDAAPSVESVCRICGARNGTIHAAREMMFGMRNTFNYFECGGCGCLQIIDRPNDLSPYYPAHYYSFNKPTVAPAEAGGKLRRWLRRRRNAAQVFKAGGLWGWVASVWPRPDIPSEIAEVLSAAVVRSLDMRVLDVGSGGGELLQKMSRVGFCRLTGVDPYLTGDIEYGPDVRLLARPLESLAGEEFDLIMFNHSLEHVDDPLQSLRSAASLLSAKGICVVAMPVKSSDVWLEYGTDWVELDAPRHLVIHTYESFEYIVARAGLRIVQQECVETAFARWGSELYRRDIPLCDMTSKRFYDPRQWFPQSDLERLRERSKVANANGRGGRARFYLQRS